MPIAIEVAREHVIRNCLAHGDQRRREFSVCFRERNMKLAVAIRRRDDKIRLAVAVEVTHHEAAQRRARPYPGRLRREQAVPETTKEEHGALARRDLADEDIP